MKKFTTMLVLVFVMSTSALFAQTRQITGTVVTAEDNSPIIGATVLLQGTSSGAITDTKGKFSLKATGNVQVEVSYMGYETKVTPIAASASDVVIQLKHDAITLDEIVITGLGISREKKALGYATQALKAEELTAAGNPSIITSLQGKVAGVEIKPSSGMPGASSQITIRGARSFTGNNQPLYVIDGMPVSSGASVSTLNSVTGSDFSNRAIDIDPNDIADMNFLKGQAASALYGIRASNGVVVITTKSGKGLKAGKPVVSFSNTTSFDVISRKPEYQQKWAMGIGSFSPTSSFSWGPAISSLPDDPIYGGNGKGFDGMYRVPQMEQGGYMPAGKGYVKPAIYDNVGEFMNTGVTASTSANVSQATELSNYSLGLSNTTQKGIIPETGMNRYGAKLSAETKLANAWKSGFTGNYAQTRIEKAPAANDAILAAIYGAPSHYDMKGTPYNTAVDPYKQLSYRGTTFDNPYWAAENNYYGEKTNRFFGNAYVQFDPQWNLGKNQKFSFKYQIGVDSYSSLYEDVVEYGARNTKGSMENKSLKETTYNSLFTANYDLDITKDLKLNFLVGNEISHTYFSSAISGGYNFNFGGWPRLSNITTPYNYQEALQDRTVGFFGNLALSYKSMLFLNVTGREDIMSIMPTNNRSFFYPSVSLGFVFTELGNLKESKWLNYGKIRASYAEVGQADRYYNNYYSLPNYGGGFYQYPPLTYPVGGVTSYIPYRKIYDPNLRPQNTSTFEVGADFRLFNNFLEVDYTYSRQNVKDQIFPVPLSGSTGYEDLLMNGGSLHTDAHELVLTANIIRKRDFDWNIGINFTKMKNMVDELAPGVESIFLGGFVTPQVRAGIGYQFPVIYGESFKRDDHGRVLVNEDPLSASYGMPMPGGPAVIGDVSPNFIIGFNTMFRYKDITLRATLDWKNGGQMYHGTNGLMNLYGVSKVTEDRTSKFIYEGYKADGTPNDIVRGGSDDALAYYTLHSDVLGNIDESYIYDNDFVKLREVSVNYRVKAYKSFTIGVTAFARNIFIWSKLPNFDPESSQGNTNMGGSFERFSLPQTSSYGFGVNLTF